MYSLSRRWIRNGTQARPLSIQITLSLGKRSGSAFITQLDRCSMLKKVKPSACTTIKRFDSEKDCSCQEKPPWKASGRPRSSNMA